MAHQQRNLVEQVADLGGSVAAIMNEKLMALEAEHRQLAAEREGILDLARPGRSPSRAV